MSATIDSQSLKENYNSILESLAGDAFKVALEYFEKLVDENGNKVSLNFEDICNCVTNAAQLARREFVAKNQ